MKMLKFSAIWCPSCLVMYALWKQISEEYNIEMMEYDYDENYDMVEKWQIGKTIPVVIFVDQEDKEIGRLIGEHTKKEIEEYLQTLGEEHEQI